MRIDFDPAKDASNFSKHGLSLAVALELDWDEALVWIDERQDYGEMRMIALAPKTGIFTSWPSLTATQFVESSVCGAPTDVR